MNSASQWSRQKKFIRGRSKPTNFVHPPYREGSPSFPARHHRVPPIRKSPPPLPSPPLVKDRISSPLKDLKRFQDVYGSSPPPWEAEMAQELEGASKVAEVEVMMEMLDRKIQEQRAQLRSRKHNIVSVSEEVNTLSTAYAEKKSELSGLKKSSKRDTRTMAILSEKLKFTEAKNKQLQEARKMLQAEYDKLKQQYDKLQLRRDEAVTICRNTIKVLRKTEARVNIFEDELHILRDFCESHGGIPEILSPELKKQESDPPVDEDTASNDEEWKQCSLPLCTETQDMLRRKERECNSLKEELRLQCAGVDTSDVGTITDSVGVELEGMVEQLQVQMQKEIRRRQDVDRHASEMEKGYQKYKKKLKEKEEEFQSTVERLREELQVAQEECVSLQDQVFEAKADMRKLIEDEEATMREAGETPMVPKDRYDSLASDLTRSKELYEKEVHRCGELETTLLQLKKAEKETTEKSQQQIASLVEDLRAANDKISSLSADLKTSKGASQRRGSSASSSAAAPVMKQDVMVRLESLWKMERAAELSMTCVKCKQLMRKPVITVPCGHSACAQCVVNDECPTCGPRTKVTHVQKSEALFDLCTSLSKRRSIVGELKNLSNLAKQPEKRSARSSTVSNASQGVPS